MNSVKKDNEPLYRIIKRNMHLFDQYHKDLNDKTSWLRGYFYTESDLKMSLNNKELVEMILDEEECREFKEAYKIYQRFLDIVNNQNDDYNNHKAFQTRTEECKKALNSWLDYIFDTKNKYFIGTVRNFRKKWFLPILRVLTFEVEYKRNGKTYKTSLNNGYIESMNNKVKLVKRNTFGYRYFNNLRKRLLMHLGFSYELKPS